MTAEEYERRCGVPPKDDVLERANCDKAGTIGHMSCGWCYDHNAANIWCTCALVAMQKATKG